MTSTWTHQALASVFQEGVGSGMRRGTEKKGESVKHKISKEATCALKSTRGAAGALVRVCVDTVDRAMGKVQIQSL